MSEQVNRANEVQPLAKPQLFVKNLTFNDGTSLNLTHNSIVVFTGANNSGKSQALKDLERFPDEDLRLGTIVVKDCEYDCCGDIDEKVFFDKHFKINDNGYYYCDETDSGFNRSTLRHFWERRCFTNGLRLLFVKRLSTEFRLTSANALNRNDNPERHPIYKLNKSEALAQKVSDYFRQAFGTDLVVNRREMRTIPLHVGQAPDKTAYTIKNEDEYYEKVSALPRLDDQGDGMRSFASILLDTFTTEHSITLIDEPEAFLHPPQARLLGKMLAKSTAGERQLFISTHSEDFLQGIIDAENKDVTIIRIDRKGNINEMSILESAGIKEFWENPLLRYSDILSGLFHEKVVVCESDYDCLFYHAVLDAMCESEDEIAPDILFTHCGGKTRIKDVVKALKAINVPVVAISDFDLINNKQNLKGVTDALGIDWNLALNADMKTIYDDMNSKAGAWESIKETGRAGFRGETFVAYSRVESVCKSAGLFVVPVGEMECFDKMVTKTKKEWVYEVIEKCDFVNSPDLQEARKFVKEIAEFR